MKNWLCYTIQNKRDGKLAKYFMIKIRSFIPCERYSRIEKSSKYDILTRKKYRIEPACYHAFIRLDLLSRIAHDEKKSNIAYDEKNPSSS